jgi:hypothetical protein
MHGGEIFVLRVRAEKGVNAIRALRAWLKRGRRDFGLVCVEAYQARGDTDMPINYADADDQRSRELLPSGVYQLKVEVQLGGYGEDATLMLAKSGRSMHVALIYKVVEGEHRGYKIWDNITVALVEDKNLPPLEADKLKKLQTAVRMGRAKIKALINSARRLDPDDKSEATEAKRALETHDDLTGMVFWAQIEEQPGGNGYGPRNIIDYIIQLGDADYPVAPAQSSGGAIVPKKSIKDDMDDSIPF